MGLNEPASRAARLEVVPFHSGSPAAAIGSRGRAAPRDRPRRPLELIRSGHRGRQLTPIRLYFPRRPARPWRVIRHGGRRTSQGRCLPPAQPASERALPVRQAPPRGASRLGRDSPRGRGERPRTLHRRWRSPPCLRKNSLRHLRPRLPARISCKTRAFCPSCHQKRMLAHAQWVEENVLAPVPHRQYVFTLPKLLRPHFHHRPYLGELCRIVARLLKVSHQHTAPPRAPAD